MKIIVTEPGRGKPENPHNQNYWVERDTMIGHVNQEWIDFDLQYPTLPCLFPNGDECPVGEYDGRLQKQWKNPLRYDSREIYLCQPVKESGLDLNKIESRVDNLIANSTAEDYNKKVCGPGDNDYGRNKSIINSVKEDKNKTVEEAAFEFYEEYKSESGAALQTAFIRGATWQKEQTNPTEDAAIHKMLQLKSRNDELTAQNDEMMLTMVDRNKVIMLIEQRFINNPTVIGDIINTELTNLLYIIKEIK